MGLLPSSIQVVFLLQLLMSNSKNLDTSHQDRDNLAFMGSCKKLNQSLRFDQGKSIRQFHIHLQGFSRLRKCERLKCPDRNQGTSVIIVATSGWMSLFAGRKSLLELLIRLAMDLNMSSTVNSFTLLPDRLQLQKSYIFLSSSNRLDNLVRSKLVSSFVRRFDHFWQELNVIKWQLGLLGQLYRSLFAPDLHSTPLLASFHTWM